MTSPDEFLPCSCGCGLPRDEPGTYGRRYRAECHARYMRQWRARKKAEKEALKDADPLAEGLARLRDRLADDDGRTRLSAVATLTVVAVVLLATVALRSGGGPGEVFHPAPVAVVERAVPAARLPVERPPAPAANHALLEPTGGVRVVGPGAISLAARAAAVVAAVDQPADGMPEVIVVAERADLAATSWGCDADVAGLLSGSWAGMACAASGQVTVVAGDGAACTLVHELGHWVEHRSFTPEQRARLQALHAAQPASPFAGPLYAAGHWGELWAEAVAAVAGCEVLWDHGSVAADGGWASDPVDVAVWFPGLWVLVDEVFDVDALQAVGS